MINTLLDKPPSLEVWCGKSHGRWAKRDKVARAELGEWLNTFPANAEVHATLRRGRGSAEHRILAGELKAWLC